jgi:TPP-dependent indolepyruvate ferredoxin oxidoreductase alpha subunit
LQPRSPNFCPGCTHRAFYYALNATNQHVVCDSSKCIGCGTCEKVCSFKREHVSNSAKSRIRVARVNEVNRVALTCQVCSNAPCVASCNKGALSKCVTTGVISVDENKCVGCGLCVKACLHGAVFLDSEKRRVLICDTCQGEPACVKSCPKYALTLVGRSDDKIVTGDIGCYSLGVLPPLNAMQTCLCMGGGISQAAGMVHAGVEGKVFAVIGDSTFFHAGMPGLLNIAYNKANVCVIILDNRIVAMTGHQPTPASGQTAMGDVAKAVNISDIVKSVGIDKIVTVDPSDIKASIAAIRESLTYNGPCVIIAQRSCPLLTERGIPYEITEKCGSCGLCVTRFGCPAISQTNSDSNADGNDGGRVEIDSTLCNGCGVCVNVCPHNAISRRKI